MGPIELYSTPKGAMLFGRVDLFRYIPTTVPLDRRGRPLPAKAAKLRAHLHWRDTLRRFRSQLI